MTYQIKNGDRYLNTKVMKNQRFNLVLNEEQINYLLLAIECFIDNEIESCDGDEKSIEALKKIEKRLRKNY